MKKTQTDIANAIGQKPGPRGLVSGTSPDQDDAMNAGGVNTNQAGGLRAVWARNTMRPQRGPAKERGGRQLVLIDREGQRSVCASCGLLAPWTESVAGVFICDACGAGAEAHLRELAESIPELRDHRLKRWRKGCDCDHCLRRRAIV
jgi:hypothetical protein